MARIEYFNCPLKEEFERAVDLGNQFTRVMRRIRKHQDGCYRCGAYEDCLVRARFYEKIDSIIFDLNEEWGLA